MNMNILLESDARFPTRGHEWDAGLDLYATEDAVIPRRGQHTFGTGLHIEIPKDSKGKGKYFGLVFTKSGLCSKESITSMGIIDTDYTGEIKVTLQNHRWRKVKISKGQKISQLIIVPCVFPELVLTDKLGETERGDKGFGSTGRF